MSAKSPSSKSCGWHTRMLVNSARFAAAKTHLLRLLILAILHRIINMAKHCLYGVRIREV